MLNTVVTRYYDNGKVYAILAKQGAYKEFAHDDFDQYVDDISLLDNMPEHDKDCLFNSHGKIWCEITSL